MKLFLSLVIISSISCANFNAYYNIFYNAQKYYDLGIKPLQNGESVDKNYLDRSIEKSSKILQFHQNSKYVDDALIIIGKAYMYKSEYSKAIKKFSELMEYFPQSDYFDEALYFLGKTYLLQNDTSIAISIFSKVVSGQKKFMDESVNELINIYVKTDQYQKGDSIFESLPEKYKRKPVNILLQAKLKFLNNDYEGSLKLLKKLNVKKLPKEYTIDYYFYLIYSFIQTGDLKNAEKYVDRSIQLFQDHSKRNFFYFLKVKIFLKEKRFQESLKLIEDITSKRDTFLIDSLLFTRGEIYEKELNDLENAQKAYRKIVEGYSSSSLYKDAQVRLRKNGILLSLKDDTLSLEEKIKNRFFLAEIEYFDYKDIEKAIEKYKTVFDSFPNSIYGPKSLFALSYIFLKDKKDTLKSIEFLEKIVKLYPSTEYQIEALKKIKELENE